MQNKLQQTSIREVRTKKDLKAFVKFPFGLYKNHEYWIPPIIADEMAAFTPSKNPALEAADCVQYLAFHGSKIVGRIAGIINEKESEFLGIKKLRFGWFDFVDDVEVSWKLIDTLIDWGKSRNCEVIEGPLGFTNLDRAGFLVDGYDELPTISTIYNYPYYIQHLEEHGFNVSAKYIEYEFGVPKEIPVKVKRFNEIITKRYQLRVIDDLNPSQFNYYGRQLFNLINETHRALHGFVPFSEKLIDHYQKKYTKLINPNFITFVVDKDNKLIAYAITLPSYAKAFQKARGKIFPLGIVHLLRASKKVRRADLLLIGVNDEYRNKGVTALIFNRVISTYIQYGVERVESNPELEDNLNVHALWKNYESRQHKRRNNYKLVMSEWTKRKQA